MRLTYAIPDLHGRLDLLTAALAEIGRRGIGPHTVVTLGDYVDRGPQSRQVIERLIAGPALPGQALVCLMGNHEEMMVRCLRGEAEMSWWIENGGDATLASYGERGSAFDDPAGILSDHLRWIEGLQLTYADEHRVFVHAGLDYRSPLDRQTSETLLWHRYCDEPAGPDPRQHVVHGHTATEDGPVLLPDRTNLDTLAWATGRLVVGVFDNEVAGGPVDLIEVIGSPW